MCRVCVNISYIIISYIIQYYIYIYIVFLTTIFVGRNIVLVILNFDDGSYFQFMILLMTSNYRLESSRNVHKLLLLSTI